MPRSLSVIWVSAPRTMPSAQRRARTTVTAEAGERCACDRGYPVAGALSVAGARGAGPQPAGGPSLLDELDEGAERRLRVDERHGGAAAARTGRLVDDPATLGLDGLQRGGAVVDPVADVVQALALALEVLGHGRVVAGGREQLDVAVGHLQQRLLHTVGLDHLAVVDLGAERLAVVADRGLEVVDGDGDVVDLGEQHAPEPSALTGPGSRSRPPWSLRDPPPRGRCAPPRVSTAAVGAGEDLEE